MKEKIKKIVEFFKKLNYKKLVKVSGVVLYTLIVILLTYAVIHTFFRPEPDRIILPSSVADEKVEISVLKEALLENAQLSTAKLKLKAEAKYEDGGIPGITQSEFTVLCEATVKAGFDMNDVKITADDKKKIVYITVPPAEIKPEDVYINHKSLKFYDKKFALFPVKVHENTSKALALAEKVAANYARETGIIEMANKQGAEIIKGLLSNALPNGYKIEVAK